MAGESTGRVSAGQTGVIMRIKFGAKEDIDLIVPRLQRLADATLADEPGCLTFEVHAPVAGDDAASETHELLLYERYASQAAANAHSRTPTFEELSPSIVDTDEPPGMRLEGKITEGLSAPPPAHVVSVTTMGVGFVACREDDEGRTGKVPAGQTVLVVDLEFASKEDFALWRSRFQELADAVLADEPKCFSYEVNNVLSLDGTVRALIYERYADAEALDVTHNNSPKFLELVVGGKLGEGLSRAPKVTMSRWKTMGTGFLGRSDVDALR